MSTQMSKDSKRRLPRLGRKQKVVDQQPESTEVNAPSFAVAGRSKSNARNPFEGVFEIKDEVGHLPTEKEMKRSRKGKSNLTLGAKYGGRRKSFLLLALALIASVLSIPFFFSMLGGKMGKDEAKALIEEQVNESTARTFPVGEGAMWTEAFTRIYGTWDYKTPGARAADLSPYLAPGLEEQIGWDGKGTQRLIYSAVNPQPEVIDGSRAIYDVTYQIQDGTWRCAKVPVFAFKPADTKQGPVNQWGFAVTANPTPVPCALRVSVPGFEGTKFGAQDTAAAETLRSSFFPGFFNAWVISDADTLRQYVSPDIKTFGLGGAYQPNPKINRVVLPILDGQDTAAAGTVYNAFVDVTLTDANGSSLNTTYKVPVSSNGTQWQVAGEPEALVQGLTVGGSSDLPESTGKSTEGEGSGSTYSEPDQPAPAQRDEQTASTPSE